MYLNMIDLSVTGCLLKMEFKYIEPQLVPCHSYCSSVPTNLDYYNFCNKYRSESDFQDINQKWKSNILKTIFSMS
jgi:hypothetical protein